MNQDSYRHQTDFNSEFLDQTPASIDLLEIFNLDIDNMLASNSYYDVETFDPFLGISAQRLPGNESSTLEGTLDSAFDDSGAGFGSSSSTPNSTKPSSAASQLSSPSSQVSSITCAWFTCEKTFLSMRDYK